MSNVIGKGIVVIPARGGSKRIPLKNIKNFMGKPAILNPIEVALSSSNIQRIIVSTDSEDIANCVSGIDKVSVYWRPAELADDITPTVPVISDVIKNCDISPVTPVCCIYPVNPFILKEDLDLGLRILMENPQVSYVNSICTYSYPIQRAIRMNSEGLIEMINPELALTRSQDLEETFHDAGQWYWGTAETWLKNRKLLFNSMGVTIPRWRCQDIDTLEDWELGEKLFSVSRLES